MPIDEYMYRVGAAASSATLEYFVVISFIAFALVYFLAPVLGYDGQSRGMILTSMYILLGYGALVLLQMLINYLVYLANTNNVGGGMNNPSRAAAHFGFIFGILKMLLFVGAEGCFVFGLQSLRRDGVRR
ncbi:MAG TPA: hypothetical protein VHM90_19170 [Phycisphaerae bacterium]|jgi:hypothetical protein|nr:hypothetical protein [Phycisphaerae bacterium]